MDKNDKPLAKFLKEVSGGTGLTIKQLSKIIEQIGEKHWLIKGRHLKYIDLTFDLFTL